MAVINSPFESQYGFKAPGFSVDELGNITATSITTSIEDNSSALVNFTVIETGSQFTFLEFEGNNPAITIFRSSVYRFLLDTPELKFKIFNLDQETLYNTGLSHSDGSSGVDAQGKETGILSFAVSASAPDILYYGDNTGSIFGTINIVDPQGSFSTLDVNATTASTSSLTGALTVAGGVGIAGDLYVAGSLNIDGIGITNISSPTNLELEAINQLIVKIDGNKIGVIGLNGSSIPVVDTTINNTSIGSIEPSTAAFTSATIVNLPTTGVGVTNKQYVDSTALSLAIAFGL